MRVTPGSGTVTVDGTTITGTGSALSPLVATFYPQHMGQKLTPPVLANFTTAVAPATLTGASNGIFMVDAQAANKLCNVYLTTLPATPYAFRTLAVFAACEQGAAGAVFIGWSDGTKYHVMYFCSVATGGTMAGWAVNRFSNSTTFVSVEAGQQTSVNGGLQLTGFVWLKVRDDGTNVYFYYSPDGLNFIQLFTIAKASGYLGASGYSRLVLGINGNNNSLNYAATFLDFTQSAS